MRPLVFIHGTGVREPEFGVTAGHVAAALAGVARVTRCYWGEHHGSRLSMDGASIPDYAPREAVAASADADEAEIELWRLLARDPLHELRLLAAVAPSEGQGITLGPIPGQRLAAAAARLPESAELRESLAAAGLEGSYDTVLPRVLDSEVLVAALARAPEGLTEHRLALARAIVAATAVEGRRRGINGGLPLPDQTRTALVQRLVDHLGGTEYGLLGWTWKHVLAGIVKERATRYATRNRGGISDGAWPLAGDILVYQARGDGIRGAIRDAIAAAGRKVVVLAHSLGGIAAVDLLVLERLDVDLLVTVGSQAPLLHEIGALSSLERGAPLPAHFPRWVNLYDPRDLLAYVGAGVFPGRVEDVRVDNRQPFPDAHSAYWTNPAVADAIRRRIAP